jgi:hypothetical protein
VRDALLIPAMPKKTPNPTVGSNSNHLKRTQNRAIWSRISWGENEHSTYQGEAQNGCGSISHKWFLKFRLWDPAVSTIPDVVSCEVEENLPAANGSNRSWRNIPITQNPGFGAGPGQWVKSPAYVNWLETLEHLIENVPDEFMALVLFAAEASVWQGEAALGENEG